MTRAKKARSDLRAGQGREPRRPMPRLGVVATIRVRPGKAGMEVVVEEEGEAEGEGDIVQGIKRFNGL